MQGIQQRILHTPVVGVPQENAWSQVIVNAQHTLVVAFSVNGSGASDAGKELLNTFSAAMPTSALELHQLCDAAIQKCSGKDLAIQLAALLLLDETCVLCAYHGVVFLRRQGKVGHILQQADTLQVMEGKYHPDDVYVLTTASAQALFGELQHELGGRPDADSFSTQLMPLLHQLPNAAEVAMSYVTFGEMNQANETSQTNDASVVSEVTGTVFSNTLQKGKTFSRKITRFPRSVRQLFQQFFSNDVYVRKRNTKKVVRIVLPVLAVLVVAVLFFVIERSQQSQQLKEAQAVIAPVEVQVTQIRQNASQDPIAARQQLDGIISSFQTQLPKFAKEPTAEAALQKELQSLKDFSQSISGLEQVNTLPTFFDLRLLESDLIASRMDISGNSLFFLDKDQKKMIALDIESKQTTFLPIGDLTSTQDFTATSNGAGGGLGSGGSGTGGNSSTSSSANESLFLLGNGIYRFDIGSSQPAVLAQIGGAEVPSANAIRSYGKNVYLLNDTQRNIFRYAELSDGSLSSSAAWLRSDQKLDFSNVQSFAIDGDVWLGTKDGQILKFTQGKQQDFTLSGVQNAFSSPLTVYTNDSLNNLYVLEPQKDRVVILTKTGQFLREVDSKSLGTVTSIAADENRKELFALTGSLIFDVKL